MKHKILSTAACLSSLPLLVIPATAANHREAPITALDTKADITDVYAFRSPDQPDSVTLIMCVDPFLAPGNGPNYFPFDDDINYELKVDNDNDAQADLTFSFRFTTTQELPGVFTTYAGVGANGAVGPGTAGAADRGPNDAPDTLAGADARGGAVVPPQVTSLTSAGLGQKQTYTVSLITNSPTGVVSTPITGADEFRAVPANVGPRTMDYAALYAEGTYTGLAGGALSNVSAFAGTVDDPFFIDLGGAFDTLNLRVNSDGSGSGVAGVLTADQDASTTNLAPDFVQGFSVNAIAVQVPINLLTATTGNSAVDDTLGIWGATSRNRVTVRRAPFDARSSGTFRQIQRMGNPLINELIVGTGFKNRFSMEQPLNDFQFFLTSNPNDASDTTEYPGFALDPVIARVANALYGGALGIPSPPRVDLLPLVQYVPPLAADDSAPGPIADLLRLNVALPAVGASDAGFSRLGVVGGDLGGFPNGRRLEDDVTDIALRVVVGGVLVGGITPDAGDDFFTGGINDMLGDGVNVDDNGLQDSFPYLGFATSGRDINYEDSTTN